MTWTDARELGVRGRGWTVGFAAAYDRLPARSEGTVPPEVWGLSRQSAGLYVEFESTAPQVYARWTSTLDGTVDPRETLAAQLGLDSYARHLDGGACRGPWAWINSSIPWQDPPWRCCINWQPLAETPRRQRLYLPLAARVSDLALGVHRDQWLQPVPPPGGSKLVFYGTSIVHGHAAGRPGLCHTALLGRRFGQETVNLGFAGRGKMELAIGSLLGEIDAALLVVDCLPNLDPDLVRQRLPAFVAAYRAHQPDTPLLFVGDRLMQDAYWCPERRHLFAEKNTAQREALAPLLEDDPHLHLVEHDSWFGEDWDGTADPSHPNDLGYRRFADALEPAIRKLLPA